MHNEETFTLREAPGALLIAATAPSVAPSKPKLPSNDPAMSSVSMSHSCQFL